jgi:hypothetical protein
VRGSAGGRVSEQGSGTGDPVQVQRATEDWIKDLCRAHWRRVGDKLIHVKTGVLERTEPEEKSIRYDATGRHWSFKPPPKRDRGRTYSRAEREAFLEERARRREEMDQEVTEAQCQGLGIRIVGGG